MRRGDRDGQKVLNEFDLLAYEDVSGMNLQRWTVKIAGWVALVLHLATLQVEAGLACQSRHSKCLV